MKKTVLIILTLSFFVLTFGRVSAVSVEECASLGSGDSGKIDECISLLGNLSDALSTANETNKKELSGLTSQLSNLKTSIASLLSRLDKNEKEIQKRQSDLVATQQAFEQKAAIQYKFIRTFDPILPFLSSKSASDALREFMFQLRIVEKDRQSMDSLGESLITLKNDKDKLEKNKINLATLQKKVNERAIFLSGEVNKTESYLSTLSAKQQELINLKSAGFQTSVGDTPPTLEPCSGPPGSSNFCDPGFRPAFAAFSFGAPHRTGMSQYGAYGRAKSGQSAETILAAYYQGSALEKGYASPSTIGVTGYGRIAFEENYLLGIYEIPESWGDSGGFEALKAQAVAARTYALAVTNNGAGTICPTESCQVYKSGLKSGKWAQAVGATRGWVLKKDGVLAKTYYAASSGGYTVSQWGWSGIKDAPGPWPDTSYEKTGGSPWFYKGWYKSRGGASCGRNSPWLTSEEMADILNSWKVIYQGGGDVSRVTPVDTSCWGGNPYSKNEIASIGGITNVSSVSVTYGNDGSTLSLNFGTNKGTVTINGAEFKKAFNVRAPGYVGLKSSLFNVEKL